MPNRPLDTLEAQVGETHETVVGFDIEAGKVAEFAHAIRDPASIYVDEAAARAAGYDDIPAPPTFTRVSFFPHYRPGGLDQNFGFDLGFDREYVLHGEQRFRYERPLLVGDRLRGETTLEDVFQRAGRSGGSMTFAVFRTDFFDESGELVVQALNTRIETDGAPTEATEDASKPTGSIDVTTPGNEDSREPFGVGTVGPVVETPDLERQDFVRYAGASGDFNPIHYDEPYATEAGHPSVFGQGMFSAGVASGMIRRWLGLRGLESFRARFTDRVFPGESLSVRGVVTDRSSAGSAPDDVRVDVTFEVVTRTENRCVVEGSASAVVDDA